MCAKFLSPNLEQCCQSFEKTFALAAEVSKIMGNALCLDTSAKRTLSYNPANAQIQSISPELGAAASKVSEVMKQQLKILQENPTQYFNWIILGHCYAILGDFPNAFAAYAYSLEMNPKNEDPVLFYAYGIVCQHFGYTKLALQHFEKIPEQSGAFFEPDLRFRQGILYQNEQQFDDSLRCFHSVFNSAKLPKYLTKDDVAFQIAYTYQLKGETQKAKEYYSSLMERHPTSVKLLQQYSWFAYHSLGLKQASAIVSHALSIQSDDPMLNVIGGLISIGMGDNDRAYVLYKKSLPFTMDNPGFWCALAELYYKNDQRKDSQDAYMRALQLNNDIPEAWLNCGFIAESCDNPGEAMKIYKRGFEYTKSQAVAAAISNINSGIRGTATLVKVNEERIFVDIPKRFANDYGASSPILRPSDIGTDIDISIIPSYPVSPLIE